MNYLNKKFFLQLSSTSVLVLALGAVGGCDTVHRDLPAPTPSSVMSCQGTADSSQVTISTPTLTVTSVNTETGVYTVNLSQAGAAYFCSFNVSHMDVAGEGGGEGGYFGTIPVGGITLEMRADGTCASPGLTDWELECFITCAGYPTDIAFVNSSVTTGNVTCP